MQKQEEVTYNQVLEEIPRSYILDFFCGGAAGKNNSRSDQPIPGPHPMRGGAAAKNLKLNQGSPRGRQRRYLESKRRSVAASPTRQRTRWAYLDHNSGGAEAEKTVDQTQGEPISGLWGWAGGGSDHKGIPGTKVSVLESRGESSRGRLKV